VEGGGHRRERLRVQGHLRFVSELIFIAGVCLVAAGVGLCSVPAALIFLGAVLLVLAVLVKAGRSAEPDA
jgi:hypothetical protein